MISSSKHLWLKIDPGSSWVKVDGCDRRGIAVASVGNLTARVWSTDQQQQLQQ
jgi:hypothetical protein